MTGARHRLRGDPMRGERGFALLIVLWTMVLLALIVTRVTAAGRSETQIAANLRANAQAEASADGAVFQSVFHLLDRSDQRWIPDGGIREIKLPGGAAAIRIEDEAGKINPNLASPELLQALLRELGASPSVAANLAGEIVEWRNPRGGGQRRSSRLPAYQAAGRAVGPPGSPFETTAELGLVLGMTPAMLAALRPHLTVLSESDPGPNAADRLVGRAVVEAGLGGDDAVAGDSGDALIAAITVEAVQGSGRFTRRAVVRIGSEGEARPYSILQWGTPDDDAP